MKMMTIIFFLTKNLFVLATAIPQSNSEAPSKILQRGKAETILPNSHGQSLEESAFPTKFPETAITELEASQDRPERGSSKSNKPLSSTEKKNNRDFFEGLEESLHFNTSSEDEKKVAIFEKELLSKIGSVLRNDLLRFLKQKNLQVTIGTCKAIQKRITEFMRLAESNISTAKETVTETESESEEQGDGVSSIHIKESSHKPVDVHVAE
ncbi:hypothetical protein EDEG_01069 [Edhazardia aedis USNM 41457]|uniref:DEK C-terminal domain-containing protein n=1 Tax=Edhazardia aedis (strain USNM 41457) TaxID=1003232 RepID=J9DAG0_EDHAE|nr:hypothetical protein EDEG_01069 [Edhazardia aedis USNM 41457]|eukprot:EJW04726.1 hypothetical protein EDEG_01069 [Edhazardia aedis USNM 41457]